MSVKNMSRLEKYRARQAERIEAMSRAIDEGRTTVVASHTPSLKTIRCVVAGGFLSERRTAQKFIFGLGGVGRRQRF
ncbi:hypothetical protein EXT68_21890 [Pectobacterium parmentieri]|uniref:Uncharacterized protein n=1 Tax=Pectobacterium parmentieri TaxID=1905730 RepID=A0A0H3I599_PECPM|nr:hypothetical protein [Pectobacterium parmentieri]AFI90424.1 Hypothetical protein W5S_2336 [Pectobacterium parmentieri]MBI0473445.1 hypothetical protein [Pectobacterium parmentieri]MBI0496070.1 hypothetical protein [Pectobacterium parmentieri]MBI0557477.1 hypothetical protein [Pectobacterium parmentieri]MBI0570606.1 hypothetical protein [Pectobacterium parmentieri]